MILAPIAIAIVVGVMLAGGPADALEVVDHLVRDVARLALQTLNGLL